MRRRSASCGRTRSKVVVEDHDPAWPAWFAEDRAAITGALGERALLVEHTGSTSVPGLPAKPIIDILLLVEPTPPTSRPTCPRWRVRATGCGSASRSGWSTGACVRRVEDGDPHGVNLHVFSPRHAADEIERILGFRDWLRTHDDDRDRYAAAKRELAKREWKYVQNYADAKTDVIKEIHARAGLP